MLLYFLFSTGQTAVKLSGTVAADRAQCAALIFSLYLFSDFRIFVEGRYGQKLGRVQKWLCSDALQRVGGDLLSVLF